MGFRLVEIPELSGRVCKIYSVAEDGTEDTLFDFFLDELYADYQDYVDEIWDKLLFIGKEGGARIQFFRENEGRPGDGVVALLNKPGFPIRLYGIRYGSVLLILGGGGYKGPTIRSWQKDEKLRKAAGQMIRLSEIVCQRIKDKSIRILEDGTITGELSFNEDIL